MITELTTFCHDNFSEVSIQFGAGMEQGPEGLLLVTWRERRERMALLLDCVKRERPEKFGKYEKQLTSADKGEGTVVDEVERKTDELAAVFQMRAVPDKIAQRGPSQGPEAPEDSPSIDWQSRGSQDGGSWNDSTRRRNRYL